VCLFVCIIIFLGGVWLCGVVKGGPLDPFVVDTEMWSISVGWAPYPERLGVVEKHIVTVTYNEFDDSIPEPFEVSGSTFDLLFDWSVHCNPFLRSYVGGGGANCLSGEAGWWMMDSGEQGVWRCSCFPFACLKLAVSCRVCVGW
jgi:hypothetical protein